MEPNTEESNSDNETPDKRSGSKVTKADKGPSVGGVKGKSQASGGGGKADTNHALESNKRRRQSEPTPSSLKVCSCNFKVKYIK